MNEIIKNDWFEKLVEDCQVIITETIFNSRWALVEGYHQLGERIREDSNKKPITKLLQDLGVSLGKSDSTLWYAVQFYDKYPDLTKVPEGKNISWNKIITKYLPEPKKPIIELLPEGKFEVIYCDPPWKYDVDLSSGATRSPENNYPVMDLEDIKNFGEKIKEASNKNCILFMWITAPKLNWMNAVLEAWGFEYKTNLIWDKIKPNMGHYSSVRHELLVIAGKGTCSPTCDGKTIQSIDSVQSIEKSARHSEKPIEFVEIIEKLYPDKKYLELFARNKNKRKNWTYWGNEANGNN